METKEQTVNHNYSDCPLKLMRKHILAIDFILQGNLEAHYLDFLSSLFDVEEYAAFSEEIKEVISELSITEDQILNATENFIKIPC